ncbi:zinc metallopeptidase, partial [Bacteroides uniformis]|uniref:zinc metallopeptidase n=1 Tax=Bacteroides uniformis TaxID=820 RepID=UPI000FF46DC8
TFRRKKDAEELSCGFEDNHAQAEDALRSAAYTYVVAALGSLATLIYYIMIFLGRRD